MALPFFGIGMKTDLFSPVATAEFSKFAGLLSAAKWTWVLQYLQLIVTGTDLESDRKSFESQICDLLAWVHR